MAQLPQPVPPPPADAPSMEDILSSIRQILNEGEADPAPPEAGTAESKLPGPPHDVLLLNEDMMVPDPLPASVSPSVPPPAAATAATPPPRASLVAPASAQAAASSLGNLARTLAHERSTAVSRGGPTIEDLVRDEIRPLVKEWLDDHLPALVERLVRVEIERVVGQSST